MITFILIIYAISTIYLSVTERFKTYVMMVALQGILLFGMALTELTEINIFNLIFVLLETLIFKGILVPYLLDKILKKSKIYRVHEKSMPGFYSLFFIIIGLIISILFTYSLKHPNINNVFFAIALFSLYTGLFMMVSHRKIFTHLIGFLTVENAVFLLSFSIGNKMPMLINMAIFLDIFVTVLILSVFITKIGDKASDFESENLTTLKN